MKTYDPKQIQVIVGGVSMQGFADDSVVKVTRLADAFTQTIGVDGEGTRAKSNDNSAEIEISLKQSSDSNAFLSSLANADRLNNGGVVPVMVKDNNGTSLHMAEQAYIKKMPDSEYNKTASDRVWTLVTDNILDNLAGY
jgi:hypothetical protein